MTDASTIGFVNTSYSQDIELPMPINPFELHLQQQQEMALAKKRLAYKAIGDRLYRLFVTNEALGEVAKLYKKGGYTNEAR